MSTGSIYRQQAILNEQAAIKAQSERPDWAIIMCFYSALHWVNDHAYRHGKLHELDIKNVGSDVKTTPHKLKKTYVKRFAKQIRYLDLETYYKLLYDESMKARYLEQLQCSAYDYYSSHNNFQVYFGYLTIIKTKLS